MGISRRHVLHAIPAFAGIGSTVLSQQAILAQDVATPAGTPLVVDPAVLLGRLQAAEVQTPLFPADTGRIQPAPWIDEGDTDLIGTVGGVLMQAGQDENRNFIGPGVYLVFADESTAQARLDL